MLIQNVLQLEELTSSEAHNLFDACLLQHTHRSHSDHLTAMAAQINQSHRPLTVKVLFVFQLLTRPSVNL